MQCQNYAVLKSQNKLNAFIKGTVKSIVCSLRLYLFYEFKNPGFQI